MVKVQEEKPEIYSEIVKRVNERCGNESELRDSYSIEEEVEDLPLNGTIDYIGILACAIEVGENVTNDFDLGAIYQSFEARLLNHLANVTDCPNAGDADAIQACFDRESQAAMVTYRAFVSRVREVSIIMK